MPETNRLPFAGALAALLLTITAPASARDNFLIILADDLGVDSVAVYSDDTLYGHPGEGANHPPTPRIDALASEGILFRNAYSTPSCAPTRAQLLTGLMPMRTGIGQAGGAVLDTAETTLPELVAATHHSAAIGKWHVGPGGDIDHPIDSGFDYYAGYVPGNIDDYYLWDKTVNSSSATGTTTVGHTVYATDDASAEVIAKIAEFGADPWLIYLAFNAPHAPFHVPTAPLTTSVNAGSSNRVKFEAAVEAMDREIGNILDSMPSDVLADTTIIFLGDNGTPSGVTRPPFDSAHAKGEVYEGGTNVPLIIRSPHIAVDDRGTESLALVHASDIFATIAKIAGVNSSAADSVSLLPYLADPALPTQPFRPYAYAEQFSPNGTGIVYTDHERAISDGRYKLIWRNGVHEEFFDLDSDRFEADNLLPYDDLTEEEQAAFVALVQAMDGVEAEGEAACPTRTDATCTGGFEKALLDWRFKDGDSDRAKLVLKKGPATSQADYGDPTLGGGSAYSVCVYDDADALVAQMRVARAGDVCSEQPCWSARGGDVPDGRGFRYKDKLTASSGVLKIALDDGDPGKSKLKVIGKGTDLHDGVTERLAMSSGATAQLRGSDMTNCRTATLVEIQKQDATRFKAR